MQDNHSHPLPTNAPTDTTLSSTVRPARLYLRLEDLFPPLSFPARRRWMAVGAGILAVTAAVGVFLWHRAVANTPPPAGDGGILGSTSVQTQDSTEETTYEDGATDREPADDTAPAEPTDSEPTEADTSAVSNPDESETGAEGVETLPSDETASDTEEAGTEIPTEADTETSEETSPIIPEGCLGFASVDVSQSELGVGYLQSDGAILPEAPPVDSPWKGESPAVLIVNTHPYEGYGGDAAWYDPAADGLAITDSPNDPDGVVALGTALARALRERGVTVIHLRVPVSAEDTMGEITTRTEEAIRYYCRLYPDIGLVLDLRRSAELTADGRILATQGQYGGEPCAQLRISVSGGRDKAASACDLAVAQSIRESLWAVEPTLSRPVRVKGGGGIAGDLADLRILTLEMGSAGNTYAEAAVLVEPLGDAVTAVLKKYS